MEKVAEVIDLNHVYPSGVHALRGICLSISKGSKVAIVGQNGSGKTTLSKHFNGLLKASSGRVFVNGENVCKYPISEMSRMVGYVFQNPNYQLFSTSVRAEIEFGLKNLGIQQNEREKRLAETLETFGLTALADKQPLSFSSGVRKIVALASVYAMRPEILFLDEPTTGQDNPGKEHIGKLIDRMTRDGHTIAVITHDMNFVAKFIDRVIVMAKGQVIMDGSPREVFSAPEIMRQAHIQPPQAFALAGLLSSKGVRRDCLSSGELASEIVKGGLLK